MDVINAKMKRVYDMNRSTIQGIITTPTGARLAIIMEDTLEERRNHAGDPALFDQIVAEVNTPLEWAELWAAMRPEPHVWVDTTEAMFDNQLNVLPPQDMGNGGFLVGEPNHHNAKGEPVYACFSHQYGACVGDYYEACYMTQREFTAWKSVHA